MKQKSLKKLRADVIDIKDSIAKERILYKVKLAQHDAYVLNAETRVLKVREALELEREAHTSYKNLAEQRILALTLEKEILKKNQVALTDTLNAIKQSMGMS